MLTERELPVLLLDLFGQASILLPYLATAMKSLTGPLRAQAKLGRLELHPKANSEQVPNRGHEELTIKFVYCPPGISWAKTLESEARTLASKQL